jgi:tetratricopeptide (TPR) repeat protein
VSYRAIFWTNSIAIVTTISCLQVAAVAIPSPEIQVARSNSSVAGNLSQKVTKIAQKTKSKTPDKYLSLAVEKYRQKNYSAAIVNLDRAIKLKADYAVAYDLRGLIKYQNLKDFPGALADFDRALGINPNFVTSYYNRGLLKYRNLNDKPGGIADMKEAARLFQVKGDTESAQDANDFLKRWGVTLKLTH